MHPFCIFAFFCYPMDVVATGITPFENWLKVAINGGGQYLAQGFKGVLTQIRGDWEFYTQTFKMPRWDNAENMCWICRASAVHRDLLFTACGLGAGWRRTRRTHESWTAELAAEGKSLPLMFLLCIGLRIECVTIDVLHCVDQGVASHILGNIFFELIFAHAFGQPTLVTNLAVLEVRMKEFYKAHGVSGRV